ncbi:hypothetical protein P3339_02455 [Microbulbifer sp. MLAF003]|uniref:hypothetical protein n=1 Tax=unclassified Microbulbifer TaxID=2619833 RepID=UPI0024AD1CEB|nr:hypothetical protein [Microbulbifer sp. MLAF003]WHI51714.1 hypothetical protein P3339_02455 [Microbulbifer sp. MLAF003]
MKYLAPGRPLAVALILIDSVAHATLEIHFAPAPEWVVELAPAKSGRPPEDNERVHLSKSQILHQGQEQKYYFQATMQPLYQL